MDVSPMRSPDQPAAGAPHLLRLVIAVGVSLSALLACDGSANFGDVAADPSSPASAGSSGATSVAIDVNAAGPRPLSRLSRREYNNTVRDLLGDATQPANDFPDDREPPFLFRRAAWSRLKTLICCAAAQRLWPAPR